MRLSIQAPWPFRGLRQVAYATVYTGGSDGFVASTAAPIATGGASQFLGGSYTR